MNNPINIDPILRLFHVGGRGPFGPAETLLRMREDMTVTLFEASMESLDEYNSFIKEYKDKHGVSLSVVHGCLSNTVGKKEFYIDLIPTCSSLYMSHPDARHWTHVWNLKWGDMCAICDSIYMETSTIDQLYTDKKIKMPNFLSIDAQGSEYDILEGSLEALKGDVVGIVTEVEFSPIYDGQKLFSDQDTLLRQYQFYLCDILSREYWHPGPVTGIGHLTAAEAFFLRDYRYFVNKNKEPYLLLTNLSKLAMVAHCFGRTSYSFEIMKYIMNNWNNEWNTFKNKYNNKYLHTLAELFAILMLIS